MNPPTPQPGFNTGTPYQPPAGPAPMPQAGVPSQVAQPVASAQTLTSQVQPQPVAPAQPIATAYQPVQTFAQQPPVAPPQPVAVQAQPWQTQPTAVPQAPVYTQPVYGQAAPQPQVAQPWAAPNQQPVYGSPVNQYQFVQQQGTAALGKLRKKVIRIMVAVALFMSISAGIILLLATQAPRSSGYSQSDLRTYDKDGVSFTYPHQWVDIHDQVTSAAAAFGDNANINDASAIITVQSEDEGFGPLEGLTSSQIAEFESTLKGEVKSTLFRDTLEADSGCVTVDSNTVEEAPSDFSLKGVKFTFTCSRSNKQQLTIEGYLGIATDGKVYVIEIIGLDSAYKDNADVFDNMLNSLKVG